jgi:outer membrane receptor for ferrienterochelin and colicin
MRIDPQLLKEKLKESALTVESMSAQSIKETPASDFYEALGHLKGVDITAASLGFRIVNTRGFNSTSPVRTLQPTMRQSRVSLSLKSCSLIFD